MVMMAYSTPLISPQLESHHQIQSSAIPRISHFLYGGGLQYSSTDKPGRWFEILIRKRKKDEGRFNIPIETRNKMDFSEIDAASFSEMFA